MINSTHPIKSLNTFTRTLDLLIPISYNITKELVGRVILMEINEKLRILTGAAKYVVSCSSSGSNRSAK